MFVAYNYLFLDAQSYPEVGGRAIPYDAKAINIVSIRCFLPFEGFCSGGEWVLFGAFQSFQQFIGGAGEHGLCLHIIIKEVDLEFLVLLDESIEKIEDLGIVLVHRQDGHFVSEVFFAVDIKGIGVFAAIKLVSEI